MRELAESYWYCHYAWLRRTGLDPASATAATLAGWTGWLTTDPPQPQDAGAARLREWLLARLASNATHDGPPAFAIDAIRAEGRFAQEPAGEPDAIFQRRWALTILESAVEAQRGEYAGDGKEMLFEELLPFSGFESAGETRYAETASHLGMSTGAVRKAVFDFRTRQRDLLRAFVGDTVADPADIESEITALFCAADAPGPAPTALHEVRPEEMLARAMRTAKISGAGGTHWTPPTPEEMAHLFPHYEILSMLGRGGMGAVYKARQIELDRLVALKLLPLEISVNQDFADRFRREARAMAKLNHPNIITVHDFGQTAEGHLFFAMEFVEGANLHDIIHGPGLDAEHALSIAGQVCIALAYAHGKGVVHRDRKPANVMIDTASQVKVADFGLARFIDPAAEAIGHTVTGTVMGTPDHMAPEQKKGMSVDHRADIYSLGVMIYEMLCRETPQGAFDPPSQRTGCDARIDQIVLKAMQQAPERRYQSTTEMKVDVDSARTPLPAAPPAVARPAAPRFIPIVMPPKAHAPTPEIAKKAAHRFGSPPLSPSRSWQVRVGILQNIARKRSPAARPS